MGRFIKSSIPDGTVVSSIKIPDELKQKIIDAKEHQRETYGDVIERLIKKYESDDE